VPAARSDARRRPGPEPRDPREQRRIAERIADGDKTAEVHEVIAEGEYYGMCTFDQSLLTLVRDGKVTADAALAASSNPHDFTLQLQQARIPLPGESA
jgi:Tfp pilus assembly ATPase PilU